MRAAPQNVWNVFRRIVLGVREWCGDSAYERYVTSLKRKAASSRPLSREEFYVEQLNRRYSRPSRCC